MIYFIIIPVILNENMTSSLIIDKDELQNDLTFYHQLRKTSSTKKKTLHNGFLTKKQNFLTKQTSFPVDSSEFTSTEYFHIHTKKKITTTTTRTFSNNPTTISNYNEEENEEMEVLLDRKQNTVNKNSSNIDENPIAFLEILENERKKGFRVRKTFFPEEFILKIK